MSEVQEKKPFYKKWWVWVIVAVVVIAGLSNQNKQSTATTTTSTATESKQGAEPSVELYTNRYMYIHGEAAFFFKDNGRVIWAGIFGSQSVTTEGRWKINTETKEIELSDWSETISPRGNLDYEVEDGKITAVINQTGVRYTFLHKSGN